MNWTGGRFVQLLASPSFRFLIYRSLKNSKARKGASARQKAHFARVQQNSPNGAAKKKSLAKWSIFDSIGEEHGFGNWKPSTRQASQGFSKERSDFLQPRHDASTHKKHPINQEPAHEISRPYKPSRDSQQHHTAIEVTPEPARVPGYLYNAAPTRLISKPVEYIPVPSTETFQEQDESIVEKKRKILRKGDWVGVTTQRPLGLSFTSLSREENVGKRRKLSDGRRAMPARRPPGL